MLSPAGCVQKSIERCLMRLDPALIENTIDRVVV